MSLLVETVQELMISQLLVRPTYQYSVSGFEVRPVAALLEAVNDMDLVLTSPSQDEFHPLGPGL